MNYADWYTDRMDIYRNTPSLDGALTSLEPELLYEDIPCRIYQSDKKSIKMEQTAAHIEQSDSLMCDISTDIKAGDKLLIKRGGGLGYAPAIIRAYAADPNYYYEPFGAVMPGLAHIEVKLLQQERV